MKNTSVIVALIVGICLIVSTAILSSAIKDYGRSLAGAAFHQPRPVVIPERFTVSFQGGNSPLRFEVKDTP
jgi:hypothetical protein